MRHDVLTKPRGDGAVDRNGADVDGSEVDGSEAGRGLALPPLTVSALMVTKADLIAALRVYLPRPGSDDERDGRTLYVRP